MALLAACHQYDIDDLEKGLRDFLKGRYDPSAGLGVGVQKAVALTTDAIYKDAQHADA